MSLFAAINQSAASLRVAQTGLQVVGNNIANASTPGYIRQELIQAPAISQRVGGVLLGYGVRAVGVQQKFDATLANRLQDASTRSAGSRAQEAAASDLESILGELDDGDLSTALSTFNNAWHDLALQPSSVAAKQVVVLQGQELANQIRRTHGLVEERQQVADQRVQSIATEINQLTERIARLNQKITDAEGGRTSASDAGGLRDDRVAALQQLAGLVDIRTQEQVDGTVTVLVGGDYIISKNDFREVKAASNGSTGNQLVIKIVATDSALDVSDGELGSVYQSRDGLLKTALDSLDELAGSVADVINRIHTQGQGTRGYDSIAANNLADPNVALDAAGLATTVRNGQFELQLVDDDGELINRHVISIDLLEPGKSTLNDIASQLDAIDGLRASVDTFGRLSIQADVGRQVTFGEDTSGALAALGINTFFTGHDAKTLQVNQTLLQSPEYLAISRGGIGNDFETLNELVDAVETSSDLTRGGLSIRQIYEQFVSGVAQQASELRGIAEGNETFQSSLESQLLSVTSVSIDEETIKMLGYQRTYQASARVISTANEMLETLMRL
jgi:flagellar hook-associated protein 1